jgi:protein subunit release factor A
VSELDKARKLIDERVGPVNWDKRDKEIKAYKKALKKLGGQKAETYEELYVRLTDNILQEKKSNGALIKENHHLRNLVNTCKMQIEENGEWCKVTGFKSPKEMEDTVEEGMTELKKLETLKERLRALCVSKLNQRNKNIGAWIRAGHSNRFTLDQIARWFIRIHDIEELMGDEH